MKTMSVLLFAVLSFANVASADPVNYTKGGWSWTCASAAAPGYGTNLSVVYKNGLLITEKIGGYLLVAAGQQQADDNIGHSIFDVKVGGLKMAGNTVSFKSSLQDYSDVQSWTATLGVQSGRTVARLVSTFQSSDGDGKVHTNRETLNCSVFMIR